MWWLFNATTPLIPRKSIHKIVEPNCVDVFVDKAYAEQGVREGWLIVTNYNIDLFDCEHITYRQV